MPPILEEVQEASADVAGGAREKDTESHADEAYTAAGGSPAGPPVDRDLAFRDDARSPADTAGARHHWRPVPIPDGTAARRADRFGNLVSPSLVETT